MSCYASQSMWSSLICKLPIFVSFGFPCTPDPPLSHQFFHGSCLLLNQHWPKFTRKTQLSHIKIESIKMCLTFLFKALKKSYLSVRNADKTPQTLKCSLSKFKVSQSAYSFPVIKTGLMDQPTQAIRNTRASEKS